MQVSDSYGFKTPPYGNSCTTQVNMWHLKWERPRPLVMLFSGNVSKIVEEFWLFELTFNSNIEQVPFCMHKMNQFYIIAKPDCKSSTMPFFRPLLISKPLVHFTPAFHHKFSQTHKNLQKINMWFHNSVPIFCACRITCCKQVILSQNTLQQDLNK